MHSSGSILFAAGDPGGSRALLPVVNHAAAQGYCCHVRQHGYLGREVAPADNIIIESELAPWPADCRCYVYGSSATDEYALKLAGEAKQHHIPSVHICDNWSSYLRRITLRGQVLLPEVYCLMDKSAWDDALAEGIPREILAITGQPALSGLHEFYPVSNSPSPPSAHEPVLFFISEPFLGVMGRDVGTPGHCGFTEYDVLPQITHNLAQLAPRATLYVLPHPKHRPDEMPVLWQQCNNGLRGGLIENSEALRPMLAQSDGVLGMASILLYEAWLMGLPCLSFQPNCRMEGMRRFGKLPQLCYADNAKKLPDAMGQFLREGKRGRSPLRQEYRLHQEACASIFGKIREFLC